MTIVQKRLRDFFFGCAGDASPPLPVLPSPSTRFAPSVCLFSSFKSGNSGSSLSGSFDWLSMIVLSPEKGTIQTAGHRALI